MNICKLDIYRSPNIGIFIRTNDKYLLVPRGLAATKTSKLSKFLGVKFVKISVGGSRLLGPLLALNNRGILTSRLIEDEELYTIKKITGLQVERVPSRYTSIGNLIASNDKGAVVSNLFNKDSIEIISNVLDVPLLIMDIASQTQVGAMLMTTNQGAIIHPKASDQEILKVREVLKVNVESATVNSGVPFVASGVVANSKNIIVGNLTSGPELMMLSKAFNI
jgi:translation initiation factor 6